MLWIYVTNDVSGEEIVVTFYGKELQNTNQKYFMIEKVIKIKGDELYMLNEKDTIIRLITG